MQIKDYLIFTVMFFFLDKSNCLLLCYYECILRRVILIGAQCSHYLALVPEDRVGVEVLGGVKPEVESLFPVTHPIHIHVGLDRVRFPSGVAQKLKIKFVVIWTV